MSIPGAANPLLLATAAAGGYQISRSLRFSSIDSAFLSRTPASAGNRKTWSLSFWIKFNVNSGNQYIFAASPDGYTSDFHFAYLRSDGTIKWDDVVGGSNVQLNKISNQVFRDFSAWYHFLFVVDTTNGTAANRNRLYVNGSEITWASGNNFTSNADSSISRACVHHIGGLNQSSSYLSAYLADVHFIDGQALTPSSFTEVSATTGQLIPKQYTGSFGTNGFWLKFSDNSAATATTLGKDYSGNGNNFTPNNLSVTAGAGNDSLVDTPTSYGTDTGAGGEVRGNYCTWNPVDRRSIGSAAFSFTNGNLEAVNVTNAYGNIAGTIFASSGKWYWEIVTTGTVNGTYDYVGIIADNSSRTDAYPSNTSNSYWYRPDGKKVKNLDGNTGVVYGASWVSGDVIGVALDADNKTLTFYKNGVSQGVAFTGLDPSASWTPAVGDFSNALTLTSWIANFGQRPFAYTAPSGFKALCDTNLPAPVVAKPNTVMDVALYTGNSSTQTISGLGFSPDLVWIKRRDTTAQHVLTDIVRGANRQLFSSLTNAEQTSSTAITAFNSDGFSLGSNPSPTGDTNSSGGTYAAWTWDAGSSTVTLNPGDPGAGSITSQVRANASAGFSIVTWTASGSSTQTVGHGLGVAPALIITKSRTDGTTYNDWMVYHSSLAASNNLRLNSTNAAATFPTYGCIGAPTSSVITLTAGSSSNFNVNSGNMVAYAFSPVVGYSSFGSYTGGGSSYPFVYCGFRPRLILIKDTTTGGTFYDWFMLDTARNPYNFGALNSDSQYTLFANTSGQEQQWLSLDILSNGFRVIDQSATLNNSGSTYVWAAWAESPFAYSRAR